MQARIQGEARPLLLAKNIWNWPGVKFWYMENIFEIYRPLFPHTLDPPLQWQTYLSMQHWINTCGIFLFFQNFYKVMYMYVWRSRNFCFLLSVY
jgi:hypothetical protein